MEGHMTPTGVCKNAFSSTELDVAQTLLALSNMSNSPTPNGKQKKRKREDEAVKEGDSDNKGQITLVIRAGDKILGKTTVLKVFADARKKKCGSS